jgi:transposase
MPKKGQKCISYSVEFKHKAVELYLEQGMGYWAVARKLGLSSMSYVQRWVRNYQNFGLEGLTERRELSRVSKGRPRTRKMSSEDEIRKLKAENEFLKKLLGIERS